MDSFKNFGDSFCNGMSQARHTIGREVDNTIFVIKSVVSKSLFPKQPAVENRGTTHYEVTGDVLGRDVYHKGGQSGYGGPDCHSSTEAQWKQLRQSGLR